MDAARMFAAGQDNTVIAKQLRVSIRSVQRWRQVWQGTGEHGLCSNGSASRPGLSEALFVVLEQELAKGPVAHGWAGPDLDAGQDQNAHRTPVPQEFHSLWHREDAASARL